jgi:nucleoside-diphosphate-sugar epimerase
MAARYRSMKDHANFLAAAQLLMCSPEEIYWSGEGATGCVSASYAVARLTGSLYVDSSAIRSRLGWISPYTMRQGLDATVAALQRRPMDGW